MPSLPNSAAEPPSGMPPAAKLTPDQLQQLTATEALEHSRRVETERARRRQQSKADELEQQLGRACIPQRYREFDFSTFPVERLHADPEAAERARQVRTTCERYAEFFPAMARRGTNLLLVGAMGTGKTGLACAIANTVVREHASTAIFMSAYGAVRHQRDTWRKRGKTETEALADLVNPDLLVLDEVGVQVGTDSEMLMLFEVLNGRYANRKPTVLLSNLPIQREEGQSLRRFLGERLWSRYTDDGSFVLACDWQNLRGANS